MLYWGGRLPTPFLLRCSRELPLPLLASLPAKPLSGGTVRPVRRLRFAIKAGCARIQATASRMDLNLLVTDCRLDKRAQMWYTGSVHMRKGQDRGWAARIERLYGITAEEYAELADSQGWRCAICGEVDPRGRALFVDHDHETEEIRGLLCSGCNLGIGNFEDDPERLLMAAMYLKERS